MIKNWCRNVFSSYQSIKRHSDTVIQTTTWGRLKDDVFWLISSIHSKISSVACILILCHVFESESSSPDGWEGGGAWNLQIATLGPIMSVCLIFISSFSSFCRTYILQVRVLYSLSHISLHGPPNWSRAPVPCPLTRSPPLLSSQTCSNVNFWRFMNIL